MRKLVCALALAGMFMSAPVSAQGFIKKMMSNLYGGPKVEANMSRFFLSDMPGVESKMKLGGSAGGFIGIRMSEHFAVQEDILLNYNTSELKQANGAKGDFEYLGAELAFYAMGNWKLNNGGRLSVGAGPYASYGFSAKYKMNGEKTDLYNKDHNGEKPLNPMNIGAAITIGYEFQCGFQINASCKYGIMNALDAHKDDAAMHPFTVGLGLAYRL